MVVVSKLLNSSRSTTDRTGIRGVVITGGKLGRIIVDTDEPAGADLHSTASFRRVTRTTIIAKDLVSLIEVWRRRVPTVTFDLILRARENVVAIVASSLTSFKRVLAVGICLRDEQSASRFDFMVATQIVVHRLTCGVGRPNLARYHGCRDLDFMDPKIDIIGIQCP